MPSPPASLQPIDHDPAAYAAAVGELDAVIDVLDGAITDRDGRAAALVETWTGASANAFAGTYATALQGVHVDVVDELRTTRDNLLDTLELIEATNRTRAGQLERWWEQELRRRETA